jgi:arylsulfatase
MFSSASARAAAGAYIGNWLRSFEEFPPGQKSGSFNLERVMEAVSAG